MQGFCFDIEANGFLFEADRIWTIVAKDLVNPEKKIKLNPFKDPKAKEKFLAWVKGYNQRPYVVFHNGLGFDMFVLRCLMDIEFKVGKRNGDEIEGIPVQFIDTFYWSMYLYPDRAGHSIEAFGERLGLEKIDFRGASIEAGIIPRDAEDGAEFKQHSELMDVYCERDVDVNIKVFYSLLNEHKALYGEGAEIASQSFKCGQKSFFLMSCQEYAGWKFDIELAHEVKARLEADMEEIRAEVEPQLPPRELKKGELKDYTMPAKPFKKDGTYSASWLKWAEKHNGKDLGNGEWEFYGKKYSVEGGKMLDVTLPMEMANQDQMKDWFISQGWEPTLWNYKRGPDGKPMRDPVTRQLIPTSPKMQEQGKICPNLEAMEGEIVKKVVKWLSLRNRLSVLTGWMNHERLEYDGRLPGRRTGIAATHRQKHAVICNVPKASEKVLYGKEFRSLFTVEDGMLLAAADASGVEARVQGHYTWRYDGGKTAEMLLVGDVHCFSDDTEILTESGWKYFNELNKNEKVAQWGNGIVSFVKPKEIIQSYYKGKMVHFKTRSVDSLVTPNHRKLLYNLSTGKNETTLAKDVSSLNSNTRFYTAGVKNDGVSLSKEWVELIVAIQSDSHSGPTSFRFEFIKERKVKRLIEILESLGIQYSIYEGKGGKSKRIDFNKTQVEGISRYLTNEKDISPAVLELDFESLCHFVHSYGFWDGTFTENGDIVVDTTSFKTVDLLQAACSLINKKSVVTKSIVKNTTYGKCIVSRVYISNKSPALVGVRNSKKEVDYEGMVYCVSVDSSYILTRRNGRVCVSGNSHTVKRVYEGDPYVDSIDIMSPEFDKEDPKWKPYRDRAKNVMYGTLYGCGAAKAASLAGFPESKGQQVIDAFWEANSGTKMLKDALERYWENTGKKKYLPAIDGRILHTRKKSALLNTIFQSCGGIIMDYACCFMDMWLGDIYFDELRRPYYLYKGKVVRRVIYYHDEMSFECEKEVAEEVAQMIVKAIVKAGELLKLKVPLAGEGKVGYNWCETH